MKQVSVTKTREILGAEAEVMTDEEVQSLIDDLSIIAKWALDEARVQNKNSDM